MVIYLPVVTQPEMRQLMQAERLHTERRVDDGQTMKSKGAVFELRYVLDAEVVRATMGYLETTDALQRHARLRAKYRPDSTHS